MTINEIQDEIIDEFSDGQVPAADRPRQRAGATG